jgi:pyruvate/2-oxoglutarate dehydrogenase complex dihydrolipoamide dehydrogenase (E3) component/uncharacterized membrane protein YdjX (TVP38/TMEM64 family)
MKKISVILIILAAVAAYWFLGLNKYLTLEGIKEIQVQLESWQQGAPLLAGLGFFCIYVAVTALSLPGAAVLTLVSGAIFGLVTGVVIVSFASTIGATLAFLAARFILRDSVQNRFGSKLKTINQGVEREGAFYLFTLRLVPVFPFFLINLLMGLTPIPIRTFYLVSQIGMLAGTAVYVNAGTQLATINGLAGILSPNILVSFAILGIFPLAARKFIDRIKRRRVYGKWQRPKSFDRNLVVIGGGAAGLVSAYIGAAVKAKVTLVEARKMGGDCLNFGCVPSKALIRSAKLVHHIRNANNYGLEPLSPRIDFRKVMARVNDVIARVAPHDSIERYTGLGVEVLSGFATIKDPWTVEVQLNSGGTQRLTTRAIVIAAGARPFVPPLPGLDDVGYVTSDTLWQEFSNMDRPPHRLVVLGGGPIGCELSQAFGRLGSEVWQIEMADRLLVREDTEVSELAKASLTRDGVHVLTGHKAVRCERDGDRKYLVVQNPEGEQHLEFDALICAVGRSARLKGYGLEELGIPTERTVSTNEYLETLYPNIFAAGDVAGPYQFTHTAGHQAWYAAVNSLFGEWRKFRVDYSVIPWSTFIDPEVARVGLNEQEAKQQGIDFEVTRFGLEDLDRAIADGTAEGFIKVLTVPGKDRILGVTIVGVHAGDLLTEFVLAMKHGLGLGKILSTIHIYPTLAEAVKYTAGEWKRTHAPQKLLTVFKRYHDWKRGKAVAQAPL